MNWQRWLESADCFPVLMRAAVMVYRLASQYGVPKSLLPCGDLHRIPPRERTSCYEELAQEIWLFAKQRAAAWEDRLSFEAAAVQGVERIALVAASEYVSYLRDQARTRNVSPHKALYRRIRHCLSSDPGIRTRSDRLGSYYACSDGDLESADTARLNREPYENWPAPPVQMDPGGSVPKHAAIRLARFFWDHAVERLGKPCWIPIRELTRYLVAHHPLEPLPGTVSLSAHGHGEDSPGEPDMDIVDPPTQERAYVRNRLPQLAQTLIASWTDTEKCAFHLVNGEQRTLAEAAKRIGYKGPPGVKYVLKGLENRIRDFCLLWSGLSPPDLDRRLFCEFMSEVVAACKEATESRE